MCTMYVQIDADIVNNIKLFYFQRGENVMHIFTTLKDESFNVIDDICMYYMYASDIINGAWNGKRQILINRIRQSWLLI